MTNKGKGTEIFSAMHYEPSQDHVVFKNRYSAFLSNPPELSEKLKALERSQIIVAGIAANVCVESTVRDAMQLDYEVILVSGAVTAPDSVLLRASLKNVRQSFGDVMTVQEIMGKLKEKK
jgi:ureidoacrylate peracid hydrolase